MGGDRCPGCAATRKVRKQSAKSREKAATISNWLAAGNLLLSLAFFIFMYKYIPLVAATELKKFDPALGGRIIFNLIDGGIRLVLFLFFIWGVSLWKDIRRVYEYHGAEHKTVFAFENGDPLTTSAVQKYSTYHPRCGTSFLMTVMLISIGFYMLIPFTTFWARFASRIVLLPSDCGSFLRDHPLRGQTPRIAFCSDDHARPLAAAHYDAASVRRDGAMRHYSPRKRHVARKRTWGRVGDCLAVPPRILSLRLPTTLQCRRDVTCYVSLAHDTGLRYEPRRSQLRLYERFQCLNDSTKSKPATKN